MLILDNLALLAQLHCAYEAKTKGAWSFVGRRKTVHKGEAMLSSESSSSRLHR